MIQEIIDTDPFDKIDTSFREPMVLPKVIPMNIIGKILANAYSDFQKSETDFSCKKAIRNIAVLEMLFTTGARVSEICTLTLDTVDLTNHTIKNWGKGSKERIIQIENTDVLKALNSYYEAFSDDISGSGFFFVNKLHQRLTEQSVRVMINKQAEAIGYEKHITHICSDICSQVYSSTMAWTSRQYQVRLDIQMKAQQVASTATYWKAQEPRFRRNHRSFKLFGKARSVTFSKQCTNRLWSENKGPVSNSTKLFVGN